MQKTLKASASARPFMKWAGGKTQLLPALGDRFQAAFEPGAEVNHYAEPFLGSGAVFLDLASREGLEAADLNDTNPELFVVWSVVKKDAEALIARLEELSQRYTGFDASKRDQEFYRVRAEYNEQKDRFPYRRYRRDAWVLRAAEMIFLNKTCFNGLFRVNSKGGFNVPTGRYKNPTICPADRIRGASVLLKGVSLHNEDFEHCLDYCTNESLVYFDPPYRPITETSAFTSYTQGGFNDDDQRRLAKVCRELDRRGARFVLSNSDPRNTDLSDSFFDDLYGGFQIDRVPARRAINSKGTGRGSINELLIRNFE